MLVYHLSAAVYVYLPMRIHVCSIHIIYTYYTDMLL